MDEREIRNAVRERYAEAAKGGGCCGGAPCGEFGATAAKDRSRQIGYGEDEVSAVPEGANMGLGCGAPVAVSSLESGETVMDLGSGGGFDCFLASKAVGREGHVIGVDMTPEMIEKARDNAERGGYDNVEFRLGEIEHLPAANEEVDVLISNCVINLVPDKTRAFSEAYRVLKPGGRMVVSDIVLSREWPEGMRKTAAAFAACVAGAVLKDEYLEAIGGAGFEDVDVVSETNAAEMMVGAFSRELIDSFGVSAEELGVAAESVVSIQVSAVKPR